MLPFVWTAAEIAGGTQPLEREELRTASDKKGMSSSGGGSPPSNASPCWKLAAGGAPFVLAACGAAPLVFGAAELVAVFAADAPSAGGTFAR